MTRMLNMADPTMVPMPRVNSLWMRVERIAAENSGKLDPMARRTVPCTAEGRP